MLHPSYLLFFPLDLPAIPFSPPSVRQTFTARLAGGEYERNSSKERGGGDDGVEEGQRSGRQKFGMRANRRKEGKEEKHFPFRHHPPPPPSPLHPFLSFLALNMLGSQDERCRHWFFFHAACLQLLNRRACCIETNGIRRIAALAHMFSRHAKRGRGDFPLPALLSLIPISSLWQLLMCTLGSTRGKGKKWEEKAGKLPDFEIGSA